MGRTYYKNQLAYIDASRECGSMLINESETKDIQRHPCYSMETLAEEEEIDTY